MFLDEVFDNLDRAGQMAAERWINQTLLSGSGGSLRLVFLITHGEMRDLNEYHQVLLPEEGKYEVVLAASQFSEEQFEPQQPLIEHNWV